MISGATGRASTQMHVVFSSKWISSCALTPEEGCKLIGREQSVVLRVERPSFKGVRVLSLAEVMVRTGCSTASQWPLI